MLTVPELKQAISDALGAEGDGADWRCHGLTWQKVVAKLKTQHPLGPSGSVRPSDGQKARGWKGWKLA